ncbi:twin-arginine translocase TatA/TatE family subunit [bacterium]|nr:twin-arginine translocase TatA/TatE family subunit [bacterium]
MVGTQELIWIFAILFLLFGASKLPQLARSVGKSMREFKKASKEITDEIESAGADDDETLND